MASRVLPIFDPTNKEAGIKLLEEQIHNAGCIQEEVLQEILTKNANTEYLKGFLHGSTGKEDFKNKVPVVDYADFKPYIDRIADGESSEVLSAEPITELLFSSGTSSGQRKLIPTTSAGQSVKRLFHYLSLSLLNKYIKGLDEGKWLLFAFVVPEVYTPGNLVVRYASTGELKGLRLPNHPLSQIDITSPAEVILCPDTKQSMYLQLLCGLVQRDQVVRIGTIFASAFLRVVKFLIENWQELCSNIRAGHISDWISDSECRNAASSILSKEMPGLADLIEQECQKQTWEGIIKNLWPRTKIVDVIVTGSMAQYVPILEFYCGGIPLVSMAYASSEGYFGINTKPLSKPHDISYTLIPNMAYYEFLPVGQNNEEIQDGQPNCITVDLANVKTGQHYELVVTTFAGLYRYRVGDILTVTGFEGNAPQFRFVQRQNVILSVDIDKTTEEDLLKAITNAMCIIEPKGFLLTDYTSCVDISSIPGHYVLFWELQMSGKADGVGELDVLKMEECCAAVEESLDSQYKMLRKQKNVIDPLEIRVVKHGTFNALMDFYVSQGSSITQYKAPKCIKSENALEILNTSVG